MFTRTQKPPEVIRYDDGDRCLVLRRSLLEDVPCLARAIQESLPELQQFMPWAHFPDSNTVEAQTERCAGLVRAWDDGSDFSFNLFSGAPDGTERFAGCLGMHPRCLSNHGLEIGYWIRSDSAGRGLCTLAVEMAVLAGFRVMGLARIQVGCDVANLGSRRVIEKTGFRPEGLQRNMGEVDRPTGASSDAWRGSGNIESYALIPQDLDALDWPGRVEAHLDFASL